MGRIVVGVDGSADSRAALAWALDQARLTGSTVEAVMAWSDPYGASWAETLTPPVDIDKMAARHRELLAAIVEDADTSGLDAPVEQIVAMGGAAGVLLDVAKGADLVVVGGRGHGGFLGLLLGSVSSQVTQHAPCPAVVVPAQDRTER